MYPQVLLKAEAEQWQGSSATFNPLAVHTAVPLILHEHQRLDTRLKTLAVNSGRPKFSASRLGRKGRRHPFELRMPPNVEGDAADVPAFRSDVQLPFIESPFVLPKPQLGNDGPSREGAERSDFWLYVIRLIMLYLVDDTVCLTTCLTSLYPRSSDWTLDLTHPRVDPSDGWQYARSLDEPDDRWTAEIPPQLERLLSGLGVVAGLTSPSGGSSTPRANGSGSGLSSAGASAMTQTQQHASTSWARRRRWVRVMRRRLDIPPLPFLQPDGKMYHLSDDGTLVLAADVVSIGTPVAEGSDDGGQELGSMPTTFLSASKDYVARARYLAGTSPRAESSLDAPLMSSSSSSHMTAAEVKRVINKLERAVNELRSGMLGKESMFI